MSLRVLWCCSVDAIVMDESVAKASAADISSVSLDDGEESNSITIKVQSSNKSITYKLSKVCTC